MSASFKKALSLLGSKRQLGEILIDQANSQGESFDPAYVAKLIKAGANVIMKDKYGMGAIHYACTNGYTDLVKSLLERGTDIEMKDVSGNTPLARAAAGRGNSHPETVALLISKGANIALALRQCISDNAYSGIKVLIEQHPDIDGISGENRDTMLHRAIEKNNVDLSELLIDRGARFDIPDAYGITAERYAQVSARKEIHKLIEARRKVLDAQEAARAKIRHEEIVRQSGDVSLKQDVILPQTLRPKPKKPGKRS